MKMDAGRQFDLVGQLHEIIVGSALEGVALDHRILLAREDDDRNVPGGGAGAVPAEERHAVHIGHDQILQNHGGVDALRRFDRQAATRAIVIVDIRLLIVQQSPDGLADDGLIVHQQHHRAFRRDDSLDFGLRFVYRRLVIFYFAHVTISSNWGAMRSTERMSTAACSLAAALGMPYTTLLASSCAMV